MKSPDCQNEQSLEKRRHHRILCSAPIEYATKDQNYRNLSRDISVSGIFIETWHSFRIGDKLILRIPLFTDQEHIKVKGKVVRTDNQGVGIEFM